MKLCNGPCAQKKPFNCFHKGNGSFSLKSRCKTCCKASYKARSKNYHLYYYQENKQKVNKSSSKYRQANIDACRQRTKEYDLLHRPQRAARESFRRAQKLKATPPWLSNEHKLTIQSLYIERDKLRLEKGIIYHVDHIVPLVSDSVCGLHVPWNLRVITAEENLQKGNKV